MRRTYIVIVAAVAVVALGGIIHLDTGQQPAVDADDANWSSEAESSGEVERDPVEPAYDQRTDSKPAFGFTVGEVERCGITCRDVTATVTNTGDGTANNMQVSTSLYAGENNTNPESLVWEGTEDVGTLDAGESYTTSDRIELSFGEASAIRQSDGWITIETTVESAERTTTFQRTRQVL